MNKTFPTLPDQNSQSPWEPSLQKYKNFISKSVGNTLIGFF